MNEKRPFDALGVIIVAATCGALMLGAGIWWANRPPRKAPSPPPEHVKRVTFTSETKHDAKGEWQTTKIFPKAEVERLAAEGYKVTTPSTKPPES